uniref:Glutathione S-transferase n=1 Tax=Rhabditophanes sp. KR3021 TaxID=114890 RepID=A0AC35TXW4_9BILA
MVVEITNLSFTYFDLMGKGEVARILLNYGGEQFEEHRLPVTVFNPETWPALKEEMKLPFGQLPILKFETNGKKVTLAQSRAIEFFLASRYGLMPECDLDRSLVLQYLLGIDDMRANLVPIFHQKDPLKKEELMKVMITDNILPFLSRYNNFLKENGTDPLLILKTLPYSMDPNKLFDYFCIIGQNSYTNLTELTSNSTPSDPIVEIEVIFPKLDESIPPGFTILASTPNGSTADLNYGTIPFMSCFICYRRGTDLPPITDIGVVDWAKRERSQSGTVSIITTRKGNCASISNSFLKKLFLVYKRADSVDGSGMIVADICIINESKGDLTPASFFKINKNLNKGMTGTDIFICFRKQYLTNKELKFKANVLDSFPNIQETSIAQELAMFCLPEGVTVKRCEVNCAGVKDQGSTFILTDGGGSKLYGIGLKIFEEFKGLLSEGQVERLEVGNTFTSKSDIPLKEYKMLNSFAICILSKYPLLESFHLLLKMIMQKGLTKERQPIPIERFISFLMYELIYPAPEYPNICLKMCGTSVPFESNDVIGFPLTGAFFVGALKCLGPMNLIGAVLYALVEGKILFHSVRSHDLTLVCESVAALIFPFTWQGVFVPQCPLEASELMECPVPYIAGVATNYFELIDELPDNVVCFGLDTGSTSASVEEIRSLYKGLPAKASKELRTTLKQISVDLFSKQRSLDELKAFDCIPVKDYVANKHAILKEYNLRIREAFLELMAELLDNYGTFLKPIRIDAEKVDMTLRNLFDVQGFLESKPKHTLPFFEKVVKSQYFSRFIDERSFKSDKNSHYLFYDNCVRKFNGIADARILDPRQQFKKEASVIKDEPLMVDSSYGVNYGVFPKTLKNDLFCMDLVRGNVIVGQTKCEKSSWGRSVGEIEFDRFASNHLMTLTPNNAAKLLVSNVYSLWFNIFPSFISNSKEKKHAFQLGYEIILQFCHLNFPLLDQHWLRIYFEQCILHDEIDYGWKTGNLINSGGMLMDGITLPAFNEMIQIYLERKLKPTLSIRISVYVIVFINKLRRTVMKKDSGQTSIYKPKSSLVNLDNLNDKYEKFKLSDSATIPTVSSLFGSSNAFENGDGSSGRLTSLDMYFIGKSYHEEVHRSSKTCSEKNYPSRMAQLRGLKLSNTMPLNYQFLEPDNETTEELLPEEKTTTTKSWWKEISNSIGTHKLFKAIKPMVTQQEEEKVKSLKSNEFNRTKCCEWKPDLRPCLNSPQSTSAISYKLSIATRCHQSYCRNINYDEEILVRLANSTEFKCCHCQSPTTPLITVQTFENKVLMGVELYRLLSPIYIRLLFDLQLDLVKDGKMREKHPILFFNLIYYFKRFKLPSDGLTDYSFAIVYDIPEIHKNFQKPLYLEITKNAKSRVLQLIDQINQAIQTNNFLQAMILYRSYRRSNLTPHHIDSGFVFSMYRDFLFLALQTSPNFNRQPFDESFSDAVYQIRENFPEQNLHLPRKDHGMSFMIKFFNNLAVVLDLN